ncbi:hypothetical protein AAFF_G00421350 [Aldrovandia affinis]|uniref:Uncharacterized protein n=1 Tax=Aldrovandia affinis TaxID=143900 RepID=A0AAD7WIX3_9TELE|nr:hypothetical protein AAFF_G00421350 [Aldrovandia affinis]
MLSELSWSGHHHSWQYPEKTYRGQQSDISTLDICTQSTMASICPNSISAVHRAKLLSGSWFQVPERP